MKRADAMEAIVSEIAALPEPIVAQWEGGNSIGYRACSMCRGTDKCGPRVMHEAHCLWTRARAATTLSKEGR